MLGDLINVLKHIKRSIEGPGLTGLYSELHTSLGQARQNYSPEIKKVIDEHTQKIRLAHIEAQPSGWDHSKQEIFNNFGSKGVLGTTGHRAFEKIMRDNYANPSGAMEELEKKRQEIEQLLSSASSVLESIEKLATSEPLQKERVIVEIIFDKEVPINHVKEWKKQATLWEEIIIGYARLVGAQTEDIKLYYVNKFNPFILKWDVPKIFGDVISMVMEKLVELKIKFIEVDKQMVLFEREKFINKDMKDQLKTNSVKRRVDEIDAITELAIKLHKAGKDIEAPNYLRTKKINEKLFKFIENGGIVDVSQEADGEGEKLKLLGEYNRVHLLEGELKQLKASFDEEEKVEDEEIKKKEEKVKPKRGRPSKKR